MSSVPPNVRDVTDFQFKKLRSLKVFEQLGNVLQNATHLLTVSNKYGLVFVGMAKSIKIIRTADIERLDEDKTMFRVDAREYPVQEIQVSSEIFNLALSCDNHTLAACSILDGVPYAHMFDVRSFAEKRFPVEPFTGVRLASTPGLLLLEFLWNPAISNMFATCTSDGSVTVYELSDNGMNIFGTLPSSTGASAICWSPKGKQLVVGKLNGTLSQHTPNLKVAKTIPAPYIYENEVSVINITWLSSYQFAVVYRVDARPCLVHVNSPKSAPAIFMDFDDICFSSSDQRPHQYYMVHMPEMHLLICSSSNAMDVGVLSTKDEDGLVWEQWNLEDSARADLPLAGNDETFPLGMALNLTAQSQIQINDTDSIPPKPILHILSTGGVLCSYHMISEKFASTSFVKAPEPLVAVGARRPANTSAPRTSFQPLAATEYQKPKLNEISQIPTSKPTTVSFSSVGGIPASVTTPVTPAFNIGSFTGGQAVLGGSIMTGTPLSAPDNFGKNLPPSIFSQPPSQFVALNTPRSISETSASVQDTSAFAKPKPISQALTQQSAKPNIVTTTTSSANNLRSGFTTNQAGKRSQDDSHAKGSPVTSLKADGNKDAQGLTKPRTARRTHGQSALMSALFDELSKFDLEVAHAKKRASTISENIEIQEEQQIRSEIEQLDKFLEEAKEVTKAMNSDIHTLRGSILESFAAIEEARSLESRSKDKRFVHLMKTRALDPLCAKKMREIRPLFYYLETQLQEVNTTLDKQWEEYQLIEKKSLTGAAPFPSLELIYKAMTVNHDIAFNLKQCIERLASDVSHIKSGSSSYNLFTQGLESDTSKADIPLSSTVRKSAFSLRGATGDDLSGSEDLRSLSDMLLNVTVHSRESLSPYGSPKTLSKERQMQLRNVLEKRPITRVRPPATTEDYSQLLSPNTSKTDLSQRFQEQEEAENEMSEPVKILPTSSMPSAFKPELKQSFLSTQPSMFLPSSQAVNIQARSAGHFKKPGPALSAFLDSDAAVGGHSSETNIFTLAASASKGSKNEPIGLRIGGIPVESVPRKSPADSMQHLPKSPILSSLLDSTTNPNAQSTIGDTQSTLKSFTFSLTSAKTDSPASSSAGAAKFQALAASTSNFNFTKSTQPTFPFGSFTAGNSAASKTTFTSLPPFEFSQNKNIFSKPAASDKLSSATLTTQTYEDVTPPSSPHAYIAEEGYIVEEPSNGEEEYEEEDEEDEEEYAEDGEQFEETEEQEGVLYGQLTDSTKNIIDTSAAATLPLNQAKTDFSNDVQTVPSLPLEISSGVENKVRTDVDGDQSKDPTIEMPKLTPIFRATNFASTVTKPSSSIASTSSAFTAPVSSPPSSSLQLSSTLATSITTAASNDPAVTAKPDTTDAASAFTTAVSSSARPLTEASPQPASTTAFRFALPAGTSAPTVTTSSTTFSFSLPSTTTTASTFAVSSTSQPLFGSKLSFGQSEPGTPGNQPNLTTPSIFGGSKPPLFGSSGAFSFGQAGAQAFGSSPGTTFGQANAPFGQTPAFGQQQQQANAGSAFGQQPSVSTSASAITGGSSGLFGGLGAKPNPDNVNKNIFGSPSTFGGGSQNSSLFGNSSTQNDGTTWNKSTASSSGGFSSPGFSGAAGSVSQSGFGGFQQSPTKPGGFGTSGSFGSPATFGGAPTFGSVGQMGNRLFGATSAQPTGFASFTAATDAPTFGSLATQPTTLTFNAIAQQQQQPVSPFGTTVTPSSPAFGTTPAPAFGSPAQITPTPFGSVPSPPVFGSSAFGATTPFGSPSQQQQTQGSPSFSQWR